MCKLICKWPEQGNGSSFANGRSRVMAAHLGMAVADSFNMDVRSGQVGNCFVSGVML